MNLKSLDRSIDTIANLPIEKLRTELRHFVKVELDSPSTRDGYPTSHIGAEAPSGSGPRPEVDDDGSEYIPNDTSTERAALAGRGPRDDIAMKTNVAYHAVIQAADALILAWNKMLECRNLQAQVIGTPKAECWVLRRLADVYEESRSKSDLGGLLDEARPTSRWVQDFCRANGQLPTREQCRAHARGDRVMISA